jgi:LAS superfamily LD-carboxypeptidase LdcB
MLALALVVPLLTAAVAEPAGAAPAPFPTFSGAELKAFYYASLPLPGTQRLTARPPIYGHAGADARIQQLAEARGYRLQVTPTVPLGSYGGVTLAADAGRAWEGLLDAARRNGTPLQGNSGYRSVATQREIFRRRLGSWSTSQIASGAADAAIESVLSYHSIPGYSRHHTGKTLDLSHAGGSNGSFASSAAYRWLSADNFRVAKAHGFIPSYPAGAGAQGPNPEPWEFVYVGAPQIRCAVQVVALADPNAALICGYTDLPLVGDSNGDGIDDVRVYRAGPRAEGLFRGTRDRTPSSSAVTAVNGLYRPLIGDFRGDGVDDIFWYAPGPAPDSLWSFGADGSLRRSTVDVHGVYLPVVGDFDGTGTDDILWYGPGAGADSIWLHRTDGTRRSRTVDVVGSYVPATGDFDGNGIDDVLWHAPGAPADSMWLHRSDGTHQTRAFDVRGTYRPLVGDFNGSGIDDILWYAPGAPPDSIWYQRSGGSHTTRSISITGTYEIAAGDHDDDGFDDLVIVAPPGGTDWVWFGTATGFVRMSRSY